MSAVPLPPPLPHPLPLSPLSSVSPPAPRTPDEIAARLRDIDVLADELRKAHWDQTSLPIDARDLAEGAGVEVRVRGGPEEPTYPCHGRLLYLDDRPIIEINLAEDPIRRRVVLAHALGHHVLAHGRVPPETAATLAMHGTHRLEQEANHFAMELLLPDFAICRLINQGMVNAVKLAQKFQVPEALLRERLRTLDRKRGYL